MIRNPKHLWEQETKEFKQDSQNWPRSPMSERREP
jgi:hypothetical protein